MKQTLLELVQAILAAMDSEEINSIDDTVEAQQVALLVKNVYYDIVEDLQLPGKETLFQLDPSLDDTKPTVMYVPNTVQKVETVRYDYTDTPGDTPDYRVMNKLTFDEFMAGQIPLKDVDPNVGVMTVTKNTEDFQFYYIKDKDPTCYCTFDDNTLLFDSYVLDKDDTLQKNKTMCTGRLISSWSMTDEFIPDLDANTFPYLLNKCKGRAFNELKQTVNQEATAETRRQKIMQQKRKLKTEDIPQIYHHARYGKYGGMGPLTSIPKILKNGS